ncbi:MAG: FtsQ-type POTRA domain-containing protein [Leptolyngbya sp. SIO1D8]|nr:FtsQ-type POTRA domain-containing protein [Leptolyngbya sp. SIO1D8]
MPDFAALSPEELANRRRALKRQRRIRNLQSLWRILAVSGITTGTLWLVSHPFWLLRNSDQVIVEGNELLSDQAIQSLLPFTYPQPLLEIEPDQVAQFLQTQSPVAYASVTRQLFPPRLEVHVQERSPVAITIPTQQQPSPSSELNNTPIYQPGLLDPQGNWMAQASFTNIDPEVDLPTLKVRGFHTKYQTHWVSLYQAIQTSPVSISEVDWRIPSNVILHTQIGIVHLGIYNPQSIHQQLSTLAQLSMLTQTKNSPEVEYIDVSNPQTPAVKVVSTP